MRKRLVLMLLVFITVLSAAGLPVFAQKGSVVYDYAGIFSDADKQRIEDAAKTHFSDNNCSVYIVTKPVGEYDYWGEDFLYDNKGLDKNCVVLIFSCNSANEYDMYTYGKCDRLISDGEVNTILDDTDVYDNIKYNDDYVTGAIRFIKLSAEATVTEVGPAIIVGIIFGLIAAIIVFVCVITSYNKKQRSEKYPLNRFASLNLTDSRDNFAGTFITKKIIQTNRGRSGGSGGSGGGGGHRGGR